MKLKDWADKVGVKYLTAYRWFKAGTLPVKAYQTESGTIIVEDLDLEQSMSPVAQNDAMSLFLKKTVEYSKNDSSIEDFAAYVISTFQLKLNTVSDGPKYSRNRPRSEDIQKHFQQFIPKGEKPKPNSFVIEPDKLDELAEQSDNIVTTDYVPTAKDLVAEIKAAASEVSEDYSDEVRIEGGGFVKYGVPVHTADLYQNLAAALNSDGTPNPAFLAATPIAGGIVTRSVDLNTTPQQINYTGSTNYALSNNSSVISGDVGGAYPASTVVSLTDQPSSACRINAFQPTQKELQTANKVMETAEQPRARRGRKPFKNKG